MAQSPEEGSTKGAVKVGTLVIVLVVAAALISFIFMSWRNVRPGYVGIVFDKATHQVTTGALEPGWAFINPFTQSIQEYPVSIQTYAMVERMGEGSTIEDDSIKVQSNEGQQLNLDVFVQYQVISEEAAALYQDWGGASITVIEDRVVRQYTRARVRDIATQYSWEEITSSKRNEITEQVSQTLSEESAQRHLDMVAFGIRGIHLPTSLQEALDRKIEAQQKAERQSYELEQARIKAEQDKVEAEGRANAMRVEAQGRADSIRIQAEAQAEANNVLAESLSSDLLRYREIDRWNGQLPLFQAMGEGETPLPLLDVTRLVSGTIGQ